RRRGGRSPAPLLRRCIRLRRRPASAMLVLPSACAPPVLNHARSITNTTARRRSATLFVQPVVELRTYFVVLAAERDRGLQIAELGTAVVARALEAISQHAFFPQQRRDRVGELDFTARTGLDLMQ